MSRPVLHYSLLLHSIRHLNIKLKYFKIIEKAGLLIKESLLNQHNLRILKEEN